MTAPRNPLFLTVGERSDTAGTVMVGNDHGWLQQLSGLPATALGWYLPTGQAVHLVGLRLDEDELLAAGRDLRVAADGSIAWGRGSPPPGLALERGTERPHGPGTTGEVGYTRGSGRLTLRLQEGGDGVLDDLILDRAGAALEIGRTTVGGVPAVLAVYEGEKRSSLMWQVRPSVVAELVAGGEATGDIARAAQSIAEVDEGVWQEMLDRFAVPAEAPPAGSPTDLSTVVRSMCELRGQWLDAVAGGGGREAEPVRLLRELRGKAVGAGLDQDSDIVPVLDSLLAALSTGDVVTVRSIPPGGACT